jgi:FMN-dependent NADH-azoreductase
MNQGKRILRLDASANPGQSGSRVLGDQLLERVTQLHPDIDIRQRDLNTDAEFIDSVWIAANFSAADDRDDVARQRLTYSDELIAELQWADHILLTTPMYNFSVPATLKSWIDQVCRAGVTFRYTADGPVGLLTGKRADIVITTGGAPLESPVDFVSGYLRQVFAFIGITEINIIGADGMNMDNDESLTRAQRQIDSHYPAIAA